MIENFLSGTNCIIDSKIIKPNVIPPISPYITFADPEVERICIENWSSDGIGLTYEDAAAVTSLNGVFDYWGNNPPNEPILYFNELKHFLNITILGVTPYGDGEFSGAESLIEISLPPNLVEISYDTFSNCKALTSIIIPNSVTSIGKQAFYDCRALTSIIIPNSVTSISDYAFNSCSGLTSITIPNSITSIGNSAFNNCRGLISITIPNSVTSISDYAFYYCTGLTSVIVEPLTPPIGGDGIFSANDNLINIYVPSESVDAYKTALH